MAKYSPKRMPFYRYKGAPDIVRKKVAFIAKSSCAASGVPYDVLFTESEAGQAVGLDFGAGLRGQHFFLSPCETRAWRASMKRKALSWADLPLAVQKTIISYLES